MPVRSPKLRVAFDCKGDWSQFSGEGATRLCDRCVKQVHDLSQLTRREATELLRDGAGTVCVRFTHDREGRLLFSVRARSQAADLAALRGLKSWPNIQIDTSSGRRGVEKFSIDEAVSPSMLRQRGLA